MSNFISHKQDKHDSVFVEGENNVLRKNNFEKPYYENTHQDDNGAENEKSSHDDDISENLDDNYRLEKEEKHKKKKKEKKKHKKNKKHKDSKRKRYHEEDRDIDKEENTVYDENQEDEYKYTDNENDVSQDQEEKKEDNQRKRIKLAVEDEQVQMKNFIDDEDVTDIYEEEYKFKNSVQRKPTKSSYFQTVLDNIKNRKKHKRQLTDSECSEYCQKIIEDMNNAADIDEEALSNGKPALAKLEMLDFVTSEMGKMKWKFWFVQEGCCAVLCRWIAPLKDGSLPNVTIRSRVFELIKKLPISSQELIGNDLGRILVLVWRHPEETDENKKIIRSLIQAWVRPILGVGSNYREYRQLKDSENQMLQSKSPYLYDSKDADDNKDEDFMRSSKPKSAKKNTVVEISPSIRTQEDPEIDKRRYARIPYNVGYKFKIPPKSAINKNEIVSRNSRENPTAIGKIGKMLDGRSQKTQKQAHKVSIEGRRMF